MQELLQTIVVTGAAGFIGSHVSQTLLDSGHTVIGIDNLNDYYNPSWKEENLQPLKNNQNFIFFQDDIRDIESIEQIFSEYHPTTVIHLAAMAGVRNSLLQAVLYADVNLMGTEKLLTVSQKYNVQKFIFASSSSVYGNTSMGTQFSENDACNEPISPYAATKKSGEMLCYAASQTSSMSVTCLRFFTVYGPKGRPDMAPYLFTEALLTDTPITMYGEGKTKRDYTYINDIVTGILASIVLPHQFEIINLGNDKPVFLTEFIQTLESITGKTATLIHKPLLSGDVTQTWADISKARQLLNYEPRTSLEEGLTAFVQWYQKYRL